MATYNQAQAVAAMLDADASGQMRALHDKLLLLRCRPFMPSNTQTLRFDVGPRSRPVPIAAFRGGNAEIFSFPKTYWAQRLEELAHALRSIEPRHFIDIEGPVSTSQYSIRQVRIGPDTAAKLSEVVSGLIARHVRQICGED